MLKYSLINALILFRYERKNHETIWTMHYEYVIVLNSSDKLLYTNLEKTLIMMEAHYGIYLQNKWNMFYPD